MKRTLIISLLVIAVIATIGGVAYTFGTPQAPDVAASPAASGAAPAAVSMPPAATEMPPSSQVQPNEPAQKTAPDPVDPNQAVPAPDPNTPLAIEIPGCRCHSDDPKIVEEHSAYRMNQCAGCHAGKTPTGQ